jgi:pilus assembly protein CpaF
VDIDVLIRSDAETRSQKMRIDGPMTIGRGATCTLCLEGDQISRHHVTIELSNASMMVEDKSSNGTMAGEKLLRRDRTDVPYGTTLIVGPYTLQIYPSTSAHDLDSPTSQGVPTVVPPKVVGPLPRAAPPPRKARAGLSPATAPPFVPQMPDVIPGDRLPYAKPPPQQDPTLHVKTLGNAPQRTNTLEMVSVGAIVAATNPANAASAGVIATNAAAKAKTVPLAPVQVEANGATSFDQEIELRREIHKKLLENLDLATLDASKIDDPSMRPRVLTALRRIVKTLEARIPPGVDRGSLVGELADEALGLGPLERFLADPQVNEIMVVDPSNIYIEIGGKLIKTDARFTDDERVRAVIERIVTPLGRRIDESSPLVDARLKDGSRVNAVIKPLALRGTCITIRKFSAKPLSIQNLIDFNALTEAMGRFLMRSVIAKKNIIISGGTGSGKTTLLNVLSGAIPSDERIVTIEDAAELQLKQPHVVALETRPANMEGRGEYTIRDLVKNALRMRPDRIVVGECRGGEALDMLQAMNTGHDGSLTTTHANSPGEALTRIETLVLMGGVELPSRAIREQIAGSIHVIVQQSRISDGSRKITSISEVIGIDPDGQIEHRTIFEFVRTGTGENGKVIGEFRATGYLPSYLDQFIIRGFIKPGEPFL